MKNDIIFAIHDLNQRGGQDRSTLEIVQHLGKQKNVELHAFSFEADLSQASVRFRPLRPWIRRPVLLKSMLYHFLTLVRFLFLPRKHRPPICATGACSLVSDIVHVQFVHASWRRQARPSSFYGKAVALYDLFSEKVAFSPRKTYIAISHAVKMDLEKEYGLKNVFVVYHGVNSEKFHPIQSRDAQRALRARLGLGTGPETTLLFVGTYERKGLGVILRALSLLPKKVSAHVKLVAVGAGNQEHHAELARSLGVHEQVSLLSPQTNIEEYFQAADAFVFPTLYEPFGLVILEAMSSGLPCIVSRRAGAAELIRHAESGLLLEDPSSAEELSERIQEIALDETKRRKMGQKARAVAERRGWAVVAREYDAIIANVQGPGKNEP